jgi:hypothetical protein
MSLIWKNIFKNTTKNLVCLKTLLNLKKQRVKTQLVYKFILLSKHTFNNVLKSNIKLNLFITILETNNLSKMVFSLNSSIYHI